MLTGAPALQGRAIDLGSLFINYSNGSVTSFDPVHVEDGPKFSGDLVRKYTGICDVVEVLPRRVSKAPAAGECSIEIVSHDGQRPDGN